MDHEIITLLATLVDPTEWPGWLLRALVALGTLAAISGRIEPKLPAWRAAAAKTPTHLDDHAVAGVSWLVRALVFLGPVFEFFVLRRGRLLGGDPPEPPGPYKGDPYGDETEEVAVPDLGKPDERGDAMLRALEPVFAPVLLCLALLGCGASGAQVGHTIASGAAFGVLGVDTVLADAYAETKRRIESDESYTQNEARRRLDRLGRAQTALTVARPLLEEADEAIEDFDSSDEADREAMACALDAVVRLSSALVAADLDLPERVTAFLTLSRLVPGQRCLRGAS
jgi:hypothetical protein